MLRRMETEAPVRTPSGRLRVLARAQLWSSSAPTRRGRPWPPNPHQARRLLRARARFGGVGEERQPVVGSDVQALEVQAELTDDGVVEVLDRGGVARSRARPAERPR